MRKQNAFVQRVDQATPAVRTTGQVIALRQRDPWREASESQREVATARLDIVEAVLELEKTGLSASKSIELLLAKAEVSSLNPYLQAALKRAAKADRLAPARNAIFEWRKIKTVGGGRVELLENHKGRVLSEIPIWWGPALEYYNQPGQPEMSVVYRRLVEVDKFACTYDQVRAYLTSVPAMLGRNSPARIGKNLYRLTKKQYIRRCTDNALPGDVYVADGYRADVYLAHPVTGKIWRPELTVAIDLRSRVVVGWRADEHEGTVAVQNMWAECFARWNHVPLFIYVDNGSGYKNKLMSDDQIGFYKRAGVQEIIHSLPGNPHGKGWIERLFVEIKRDFLKLWRPRFYCGHDMAAEVLQETVREIKAGRLQLPTQAEFTEAFNDWLQRYASRPHPENKGVTKASLWEGLVPIPANMAEIELKRQAVELTVKRASIAHGKRSYKNADLEAFNGARVILEYDLMDDSVAIIRTLDGRWICDAHLINAIDAIAPNRMEEKRLNRASDAIKRLEQKMIEQQDRAGMVIDVDAIVVGADAMLNTETSSVLPEPIEIDLLTFK
ncbi:Mu transposase C-terminal domain-containing protein [Methylobacter tundripaludum]|uniref:Mu transposase C-terminal domain-containing protein n=1 Tax=Methylobacter tundripaludum TaxID=173365 RepID=UPI00068C8340|nr:Mu transposase C-terminal domain-containing protein [Methylobacter tundripaludum]